MNRVMINGDDFGLNERNSAAIAEAFRLGLITDTTMMANGAYFDEALRTARAEGFDDRIGIHLNLTEGVPLTEDIKAQRRFVRDGVLYKGYDRTKPLTAAEKEAVYRELTAQVEKMLGTGIKINHADSHHHIHTGVFIAPIAVRVLKEHGIDKVRPHRNLGSISFVKRIVKRRYNRWLNKQGMKTPLYFAYVMDIDGGGIPDDTEIMVHPDYRADGVLIDRRGMENGHPIGDPLIDLRHDDNIVLRGFNEL